MGAPPRPVAGSKRGGTNIAISGGFLYGLEAANPRFKSADPLKPQRPAVDGNDFATAEYKARAYAQIGIALVGLSTPSRPDIVS